MRPPSSPLSALSDLTAGGIILAINAAFASWTSCMVAQYMCITLYGCAKLGVYLFLSASLRRITRAYRLTAGIVERVHVVWAPQLHTGRLRSPVYIGCLLNVLAYPTYGVVVLITKGFYLLPPPQGYLLICWCRIQELHDARAGLHHRH